MTTADAQHFWANHPGQAAWCQMYADTASDPPRTWALDALRSFEGASNVLEIGCHCGPLLHRLGELPVAAMGIDINANAITMAQRAGLNAIVGAVPAALTRFPRQCFDVIVSSYCLAYIAPDDLVDVLGACLRVVRHGLILIEPTLDPGRVSMEVRDRDVYVEWRHSYVDAIEDAVNWASRFTPMRADITCQRQPVQDSGVNAVTIARLTWPK